MPLKIDKYMLYSNEQNLEPDKTFRMKGATLPFPSMLNNMKRKRLDPGLGVHSSQNWLNRKQRHLHHPTKHQTTSSITCVELGRDAEVEEHDRLQTAQRHHPQHQEGTQWE